MRPIRRSIRRWYLTTSISKALDIALLDPLDERGVGIRAVHSGSRRIGAGLADDRTRRIDGTAERVPFVFEAAPLRWQPERAGRCLAGARREAEQDECTEIDAGRQLADDRLADRGHRRERPGEAIPTQRPCGWSPERDANGDCAQCTDHGGGDDPRRRRPGRAGHRPGTERRDDGDTDRSERHTPDAETAQRDGAGRRTAHTAAPPSRVTPA